MTQVILLGTVHEECGRATGSALLTIIERICPDVIFLEIPPADFPDYSDGTRSNLESIAARSYREAHAAVLVPVDAPMPDESFFRDWQYMDRRITETSPTYRQLVDQNTHDTAERGFPYLISEQSSNAWSAIYEAMEVAIQGLSHDTRLPAIYDVCRQTNAARDSAMLKNIDTYRRLNPFETGLLLVGAAHTQPIISKASDGRGDTPRIERALL